MTESRERLELVDFHCHLDLFPNHLEVLNGCERNKIRIPTVTNAPSVWPRNQELAKNCNHVRVALGLHPQLAAQRDWELDLFEKYLPLTRYVGEVGLDGSPEFRQTMSVQKRIFEKILSISANYGDKILSIHSRRAVPEVLDCIEAVDFSSRGKVVLHWFTGTLKDAGRALDLGAYFSVNHRTLNSKNGKQLMRFLPRDKILTESDAPFIQFQGRPIHPADIAHTISEMASLYNISDSTMSQEILNNLKSLLVKSVEVH